MARRRRPPRSGAIAELPPLRILSQIAALQAIYYTVALILMLFTALVMGTRFRLDLVFGWSALRGDTTQGWLLAFIWLSCAGAIVIALVALVARSKLVLDFSLSLHFIHLVIVTFYTGFIPRNAMWWGTMAASTAVTFAGGAYGCQWRELRPMYFGGGSTSNSGRAAGGQAGPSTATNGIRSPDEEMGLSRGRGRDRNLGTAEHYEMGNMQSR